MVDIAATMTLRIAQALKEIAPVYSEWVEQCAEAKIENGRLRYALKKIAESQPSDSEQAFNFKMLARTALNETK